MKYVEGFVTPVPTANKAAYIQHLQRMAPIIKSYGVSRMVECWGDDVPEGQHTDFRRAVQAKDDETVLFSWFEYPSKAVRDAVFEQMQNDARIQAEFEHMPFDGKRMIFGGFVPILDV